ncbi:hypothetical protein [Clostridium sp. UBA7339]|uniref:hypothetical protein n=1 Tax=Clostridium sp. UBA7339 TaxID=1946376 RepID=UPI003217EE4E
MDNKKLLKKYSLIKTITIIPCSIIAIISCVILVISIIFYSFSTSWQNIRIILGVFMMLGIIIPLIILFYSERDRKILLNVDIMEYIELIKKNNINSNFLYYDLIDIIFSIIRMKYLYNDYKDSNKVTIINSLHRILQENSHNGLANSFVYKDKEGFAELCDYIIQCYISENKLLVQEGCIYNKYLELENKAENKKTKNNIAFKLKTILPKTKIILLFTCIIFCPFYKINSWIFNFVTIILLSIDIFQQKDINR